MSDALKDQIMKQVDVLPLEERRRVLDFARALAASAPIGVSGKDLLRFAGMFDADDARRIAEAIEDGCERVDPNEWQVFLLDTNRRRSGSSNVAGT